MERLSQCFKQQIRHNAYLIFESQNEVILQVRLRVQRNKYVQYELNLLDKELEIYS
ncbi:Uncharacterised protein [Orientia tsutsugamushi]|nr:Uncharacterised protein [Orientia tsutsugamushi]